MPKYACKPTFFEKENMAVCAYHTKFGVVEGASFVNPEDKKNYRSSEYVGCLIAEYRAKKEYYRRKKNDLHGKYLGAKAIVDQMEKDAAYYAPAYNIMYNYKKQWLDAKKRSDNMSKQEHSFIQHLVEDWEKMESKKPSNK